MDKTLKKISAYILGKEPIPLPLVVACHDIQDLWSTCGYADAMMTILAVVDYKESTLAGCAIARRVLRFVREGEERPRRAIEAAEEYVAGRIDPDVVRITMKNTLEYVRGLEDGSYEESAAYAAQAAARNSIMDFGASTDVIERSDSPVYWASAAMGTRAIGAEVGRLQDTMFDPSHFNPLTQLADAVRSVAPFAPKISEVIHASERRRVRRCGGA